MPPSRLGQVVRRVLRRLPVILPALLAATSPAAASASAQGPVVIVKVHQASGLISPYFQLSALPGRSVDAGSLELVNPASIPVRVRLDPVDGITTNTLGSAYAMTDTGEHGATTWLRLGASNVTLAPHRSENVSVLLDVPASAPPGDYLAGVSVEALGQSQRTKPTRGLAIGEIDRYAIGVETTLAGPRHPAVHFTGATVTREPGGLAFLLAARNYGNVILKDVHGWARVTDGNRVVAASTVQPGTFVSGTSISYPLLAPREQPVPGATYRVRAALYYSGGVARLDTTVQFSHAAAVTQQNYGGRKLPQSTPLWRWIALAALALALLAAARRALLRRRRPLSRAAGMRLLERALGPDRERPVSVVVISARRTLTGQIASAIRPRLRRTDLMADLGRDGLVVICRATDRPAASALRRDLYEHLARHRHLADLPIEITISTAVKPTTPAKLLGRVKAARRRQAPAPVGLYDGETAITTGR